MSVLKCKMCGGTMEILEGTTVAQCEYCGTKQTVPKLNDERKANLYDRANHFRRNNEYDKAMSIYERILDDDSSDAEAYWSLVLCRYGVEYVEDPATGKRVPTVNRTQYNSIFNDSDYKSTIEHADTYQKEIYEAEAKAIDDIQKGILEISSKEEPFDVFICYKETDNDGRRTRDSVLATDLYHQLTQEGFKVFFSRISLEDKLGAEYEPYIFAALNSAKVMVVLGTKPEFFNAVWVKNEWSRYLTLIKNGAKKALIPAYRDMDPYDLPEEFSHLQAQDMSKLGFMQDLIRGVKKIVCFDLKKNSEHVDVYSRDNVMNYVNLGMIDLQIKKYESAENLFREALKFDTHCAEAYFALELLGVITHPEKENSIDEEDKTFLGSLFDLAPQITEFEKDVLKRYQKSCVSIYLKYYNDSRMEFLLDNCYDEMKNNEFQILFTAISFRNYLAIKTLLERGFNPNITKIYPFDNVSDKVSGTEVSILCSAICQSKDSRIVEMLLESGADPDSYQRSVFSVITANVYSALYFAICNANDARIVDALIKHGADVNRIANVWNTGELSHTVQVTDHTLLCEAVSANNHKIVELLLAAGADVSACQKDYCQSRINEYSPLYLAVVNKQNEKIVNILIEHGADVNQYRTYYGDNGYTEQVPLIYDAVNTNNTTIVTALLNAGANINASIIKNDKGAKSEISPILSAIGYNNNYEMAKLLISKGAEIHRSFCHTFELNGILRQTEITVLLPAIDNGNVEIIQLLLDNGIDVNAIGVVKKPDVTIYQSAIHRTVARKNKEALRMLLAAGADAKGYRKNIDPSGKVVEIEPALFKAILNEEYDCVVLLSKAGASWDSIAKYQGIEKKIKKFPFSKFEVDKEFLKKIKELKN